MECTTGIECLALSLQQCTQYCCSEAHHCPYLALNYYLCSLVMTHGVVVDELQQEYLVLCSQSNVKER
jgi:hypothetical protein